MEYTEHYDNLEQRNVLCDTANANGFRMIHDDFNEDWKRGDEPHGTLIFTNTPSPQAPEPEPEMDFKAEILKLKEANITLMAKIDKLKVV